MSNYHNLVEYFPRELDIHIVICKAKHDGMLLDYLPDNRKSELKDVVAHYDPEFDTYTYGEPGIYNSKQFSLNRLKKGDLLLFHLGLRAFETDNYPTRGNYLFGYFIVENVFNLAKIRKNKQDFNDIFD